MKSGDRTNLIWSLKVERNERTTKVLRERKLCETGRASATAQRGQLYQGSLSHKICCSFENLPSERMAVNVKQQILGLK